MSSVADDASGRTGSLIVTFIPGLTKNEAMSTFRAVHQHVAMVDELACLRARAGEAGARGRRRCPAAV